MMNGSGAPARTNSCIPRTQAENQTPMQATTRTQAQTARESTAQPSQRPLIAGMPRSRYIAQAGIIAAMYAGLTLVTLLFLGGLAWGPVQFRISEAVCVVAVLTPAAIPGLTIGCFLANVLNMFIAGTGALGLLDVVFGSAATLVGAVFCWKMRKRPALAIGGFVFANALIVPAYLPLLLQGLGFYTIPFTSFALDGAYIPMYLFGLVSTGIGEALVIYVLGLPLLHSLKRAGLSSAPAFPDPTE